MTDLSPAAQAVLDSYNDARDGEYIDGEWIQDEAGQIAAALRAAADQAEDVCPARPSTEWGEGWLEGVKDVVAGFRRIASELEAQ